MTISSAHVAQVAIWREKARAGTLTQDEMREAIIFLRGERAMATPSATRVKSPGKAAVDQISLLAELDGL